jgi:hypothetical protein
VSLNRFPFRRWRAGIKRAFAAVALLLVAGTAATPATDLDTIPAAALVAELLADEQAHDRRQALVTALFRRGDESVPALIEPLRSAAGDPARLHATFDRLAAPLQLTGATRAALTLLKPVLGGPRFARVTPDAQVNRIKIDLCLGATGLADFDCEALFITYAYEHGLSEAVHTLGVGRRKAHLPYLHWRMQTYRRAPETCAAACEDLKRAIHWIMRGPTALRPELDATDQIREILFDYLLAGGQASGMVGLGEVVLDRSGTRAYSQVSLHYSPDQAITYTALLERDGAGWRLTALRPVSVA